MEDWFILAVVILSKQFLQSLLWSEYIMSTNNEEQKKKFPTEYGSRENVGLMHLSVY